MNHVPRKLAVALAAIASLPASAWGQDNSAPTSSPRRLDDVLRPIIEKHDIPGMVAALVTGDQIGAIGAAGLRKRGGKRPITIDDQFHIGSDTKAMTATLMALLVEEGKLAWTTTLAEVFPELVDNMHPDWQRVTVEQLLSHRAGAPGHIEQDPIWSKLWAFNGPMPAARRLVVEKLCIRPPETAPGTKFVYSNAGYIIAGAIAEKISGQPWEDQMRESIFKPLEMSSAGFGPPGTPRKQVQPWGHTADGSPMSPGPSADNPPALGPAGTVHCSIGDWARFISEHLRGERGDAKLLKSETTQALHRPGDGLGSKYAMGWGVDRRDWAGKTGRVLHHAGSNTLWFAVAWVAPDADIALLVMCNQGGDRAQKACDEAAQALLQVVRGR